ncbi:CrcB family protein [Alkalihalobacillus hwajinpoensis]|uniref:fluoride efflux transporter FluC n=1 Tax=Guptibacillus hwajinpoensis TaxID=208199 RepID=UPI0018836274|nr:CrcB family protein [Pseudalkalibacillus hwajinpoensis]MBF0706246.1 CrcB family protein [Pseudalkalibacillus hwajinpoensis]
MEWLMIAIGGGVGAWLRYITALMVNRWNTSQFPLATLLVNLIGSFILGMAFGAGDWGTGISTGFLGALTTFSTFMYEAFELGSIKLWLSVTYISISLIGGLLMVAVGYMIMV